MSVATRRLTFALTALAGSLSLARPASAQPGAFTYVSPPTPQFGAYQSVDASDGSNTDDGLTAAFTPSVGATSYRFYVYDEAFDVSPVFSFPRTTVTNTITVPEDNADIATLGLRQLIQAAGYPVGQSRTFYYVVQAVAADNSTTFITDPASASTNGRRLINILNGPFPEPAAPTINSTTPGATSITINYTLAAAPVTAANLLIVRTANSALVGGPVDNTTYAINSPVGNGTVVGILSPGANQSGTFTDNTVVSGVNYTYTLFAFGANSPQPGTSTGSSTNFGPAAASADVALPVELLRFTARATGDAVMLEWATASERDNARFFVERSADGGAFVELVTLPGAGTTTTEQRYSYTDREVIDGVSYRYRLADLSRSGVRHLHPAVIELTLTAPGLFRLAQNSPNPFNPTTDIAYDLPVDADMTLTVYSSLGQQVAVIERGTRPAGHHVVRFDAGSLPSGVYLYRLDATGNDGSRTSQMRRMSLLR